MSASQPPLRPSVFRPVLTANNKKKKQNINTALIRAAFGDQYWLERTGNWSQIFPLQNVLTLIQKVCDGVYDQLETEMSSGFTYRRQPGQLKAKMYGKFFNLLDENKVDSIYHPIIIEMLAATDLGDDVEGNQWLFEHCMVRAWDNRVLRARARDPQARRRPRGVAYFHSDSLEQQDAALPGASSTQLQPSDF
ncbi:hypothetical protein TWF481_010379 [Arthrobotrys musiformis]|uniref:Uncharacterized protein n=1 Tax=Arthrobotrys musiformis TaxID=47236 RepID=A0AAV9W0S9_9PEZI